MTTASIFFLMRSMDAKASLQSAFSGRSSSKRMEPFAPFFLPTTLNVPASCSARRMYSPKGKSTFSLMMGSMNFKYCCCARPFSPPFVRAPSSRGSVHLQLGQVYLALRLDIAWGGEGLDAVEHARERGGRRRERRDAGSHPRSAPDAVSPRARRPRTRPRRARTRDRGGALMGDARAAYAARRRDRERGADERGGHVAYSVACACAVCRKTRAEGSGAGRRSSRSDSFSRCCYARVHTRTSLAATCHPSANEQTPRGIFIS